MQQLFHLSLLIIFISLSHNALAVEKSSSADSFGRLAESSNIQLSPDGSKIASFRNYQGKKALVTRSLNTTDESVKRHILNYEDGEFSWFKWVSNDRLIFGIKFAGKRDRTETVETRLFATNWDKTNVINLIKTQKYRTGKGLKTEIKQSQIQDTIVSILPEDPDHILIALDQTTLNYPDVYKVNVNNAKRERKVKNVRKVVKWYSDAQGQVRVGYVQPEKGKAKWIFRKHSNENWQTIARADSKTDFMPFNFEAFDKDNPELIYVSTRSENNHLAFYRYDTNKEKIGSHIALEESSDVDSLLIDSKGSVFGYSYRDDYPKRVYFSKFWQSIQKMIANNFSGSLVSVESFSNDKKRIFIHVSSPINPGEYYFLDLNEGSLTLFSEQYPTIDNGKLAKMHLVNYKARDGVIIPAFLSLPHQVSVEQAKDFPSIIMPHGGPRARDYWGYDYWVQFLTARGYAVLQMNYRGSTGYGDEFESLGKQEWGGKMIDDINDGTQWLIKEGIANPEKICIMGWSYGGYAALQAPIASADTYKCSIAGGAVSNMPSFMIYQRQYTGYRRYKDYVKSDETSLVDISPYHQMEKLKLPVLMFHGTEDRSVPFKQAIKFVDEMKNHGKSIKFVNLESADHHLSREKDRVLYLKEVENFLKQHM